MSREVCVCRDGGARTGRRPELAALALAVVLLTAALGGCRGYDYDPRDLENDVSEAVIRHLLDQLPELEPQVPKIYTITLSEGMAVPRRSFVDRFDDLDIKLVSGNQMILRSEDGRIIDAETKLSPITFQVTSQEPQEDGSILVIAAWAYKDVWERRHYHVEARTDGYEVRAGELLGRSETMTL